jgi:Flp pilus assembly protein TadD
MNRRPPIQKPRSLPVRASQVPPRGIIPVPRASAPAVLDPSAVKAQSVPYKKQDLDAIAEVAYHYLRCGSAKLAEAIFEGLASIDPREPYYQLGLGLAADHAGHKEAAKAAYQRAAQLDPADGRAEINLAELILESGDRARAVKLLESAAKKSRLRGEDELAQKALAFISLIQQTASRRSPEVSR